MRKAAIADFDGVCSGDIIVLKIDENHPSSAIAPLILMTDRFWDWATRTSKGSLSPRTSYSEIKNFAIPAPEHCSVEALGNTFHGAINVVETRNELLASAKALFSSFLLTSLSPKRNWDTKYLSEIAEVKGGRQRSPAHAVGDELQPYLRPANIKRGEIDLSDVLKMNFTKAEQDTYKLRERDILLVEGGEAGDVGDPAFFNIKETLFYQNTLIRVRAKSDKINPRHLFWILTYMHRSGGFLGIAAGTKIKHIGTGNTSKLKLHLPEASDLEKISRTLDDLSQTIDEIKSGNRDAFLLAKKVSEKIHQ
ncbi:MAG: hypothetical protein CMG89_00610 [Marinobacter sp.]|nr:hypothetical protein [Marinobacter sp.]